MAILEAVAVDGLQFPSGTFQFLESGRCLDGMRCGREWIKGLAVSLFGIAFSCAGTWKSRMSVVANSG